MQVKTQFAHASIFCGTFRPRIVNAVASHSNSQLFAASHIYNCGTGLTPDS